MRGLATVLLSLVVLAPACAGADSPAPPATDAAVDDAPTAAEAGVEGTSQPAPSPASRPILEPEALAFAHEDGSVTRLEFGDTDRQQAVQALTVVLGEPSGQEEGLDCGAGQLDVVRWKGLSTYYLDGALAGWYLEEPQPGAQPLTTANGVGLGMKLGDLRGHYDNVTVEESSIGYEFSAGELFGMLTADSDHDTVVVLWSGANCIAR